MNPRKPASVTMNTTFLPTRRTFLQGMTAAATLQCLSTNPLPAQEQAEAPPLRKAARPQAPYRIWFQPRLYHRDMDLYANMTVDASGWLDPRLAEATGKTALDWVYGLNHPYADGPDYWQEACTVKQRTRQYADLRFVSAGMAVDEWVPPKLPQNPQWLAEGLRAGKKANPDVFISIWATDPTPELIALGQDGTADLILVQGYTHSVEPGLTTSWEGALRRCDALAEAGLTKQMVFCFGHITDRADSRGGHFETSWLQTKAEEIKRRYPQMPGVAFFQSTDPDTPTLRKLVRFCDRLSGELWPGE